MTRLDDAPPPEGGTPGWYRDPLGSDSLRMFDGTAWTTTIQAQGAVSTESTADESSPPPPPAGDGRNPWERLPGWGKWAAGIVAVIVLLVIGGALGSSNEGDLKSEVSDLESQVVNAGEERDEAEELALEAEGEASRVRGLRGKIVGEAEDSADEILGDAEEEKENLSSVEGEIASAKQELADVEGSLEGAEHTQELSSFGDGTWKAEADYVPGTYRAPGGSNCYWATLNSADPYDIVSNEIGTGPQIATISAPYFQTKGCGTWERIDE